MGVWEWDGKNTDDILGSDEDDAGEFVREIRPGIFPIAPRGYTAKFLQGAQPNSQFGVFVKSIMRSIANAVGISYNKATGDYESVNYSSLREAALEDRETYAELQRFLIENWKSIQYRDFVNALVILGRIPPTDNLSDLARHQFFGRRFAWVDPQKEITAKEKELALMLTDPLTELESRGEDPDDVIARFVEWNKKLEAAGLRDFWQAAFGNKPDAAPESEETQTPQPEE